MSTASPTLWRRFWYTRLSDALRGRFDASLDWRQVVTTADLPAPIVATIDHVIRRTRLWRRENVDVAGELVAHFRDGLEAGRDAEELVKSFGDPRQVAQLIRRAKKRGRPMLWHIGRCLLWGLLALSVVYLLAGLYMLTGRAAINTNYLAMINERATSVSEEKRAWPLYRDALLAMNVKLSGGDYPRSDYVNAVGARPGGEKWPEAERFLTSHATQLAKLREAAKMSGLGFVARTSYALLPEEDREIIGAAEQIEAAKSQSTDDNYLLISVLLPDLELLRSAANLLANDARRAALQGDGETAIANVLGLFGISRHCQEKPFFVSLLVANALQRQAFEVIQETLRDHSALWTDGQLRDLAHTISARPVDWWPGIEVERAAFYDILQRLYTDDGYGDGRLAWRTTNEHNLFENIDQLQSLDWPVRNSKSNDALGMLVLPAANLAIASRKEMTVMYDRFMDRAMQQLATPLWEWLNGEPTLYDELSELERQPFGRLRYMFVTLMFPAYEAIGTSVNWLEGAREGAFVGIALELYRREHGTWPESLDELSPRWLPTVPVDRINGGPLGYRIVENRPIVYSFGTDGDDDGGRLPADSKGDARIYRVGPPSELPADASQSEIDFHDGDWVIWSLLEQH